MKVSLRLHTSDRSRRPTRQVLLGAFLGVLFAFPIQGMQVAHRRAHAAKQAAGPGVAHRTTAPPVQLCVVVRNVRGETVDNLRATDFRLWDNNHPQRITDFAANIVPAPVENLQVPGTVRYTALYFDDRRFHFLGRDHSQLYRRRPKAASDTAGHPAARAVSSPGESMPGPYGFSGLHAALRQ